MKTIVLLISLLSTAVFCSDADLAAALAETGAIHAAKNHPEQAKDALYRALVYDPACGVALFELAKIMEKEGDPKTAAIFYQRAIPALRDSSRRVVAWDRIKTLNPYAVRLTAAMEDYSKGLEAVVIKNPNRQVLGSVESRISAIRLSDFISPSKMPQLSVVKRLLLADKEARLVGRWEKSDGSYIVLKKDKTLTFSADPNGGKWEIVDDKKFIIRFGWQPKVDSPCVILGDDSFDCENKAIFTRSIADAKGKK